MNGTSNFSFLTILPLVIILSGYHLVVAQDTLKQPNAVAEFHQYEKVVPELYRGNTRIQDTLMPDSTNKDRVHYDHFTLTLPTREKTIHIELSRNRYLFGDSYVERIFTAEGEKVVTPTDHLSRGTCFYHGAAQGERDYSAAISTCHGVSGSFTHGGEVYHIQPGDGEGAKREHHVYKETHRKPSNSTNCGHDHTIPAGIHLNTTKHRRSKRSVHWPYDRDEDTRVVELFLVNDKSMYDEYESVELIIHRNKEIVNIISSRFRAVNTYVVLVGVEIWTETDKFAVEADADECMHRFLTYRADEINPKFQNDNAQLITIQQFSDGIVGKAPISTLCSYRFSGGVNSDTSALPEGVANTIVHEMGHNFGLHHDLDDNGPTCSCPEDRCIMAASTKADGVPSRSWSSCSLEEFEDMFAAGMDLCLHNLPTALYGRPVCGNGFIEDGEECDCGLSEDCMNKCCDASTCLLTVNATCATGACCDTELCTLRPARYPCRPAATSGSTCDLPEACDGKSEWCPDDVFAQDGTPCIAEDRESYCYEGKCPTREGQCQKLWGKTGHVSHALCFTHFNPMGEHSGHCGIDWATSELSFKPCQKQDVMCGMLHCEHQNEKMLWSAVPAFAMPDAWVIADGKRHHCKAATLDVGLGDRDPGLVPAGAKCGEGKMCISEQCKDIVSLDIPQCPDCHGNGVCNSLGQCHCDVGYKPPYCNGRGSGGSLHSGPIGEPGANRSLIVGLVIFFLVIVPLVALAAFMVYRHERKLKELWRSMDLRKYRSIYRSRPRSHHDTVSAVSRPSPPTIAPPIVKVTQPKRTPTVRKQQSFTRSDIGAMHLEKSTNPRLSQMDELPAENRSQTLQTARIDIKPERPAPPKISAAAAGSGGQADVSTIRGPMEISQPVIASHGPIGRSKSTDAAGTVKPSRPAPPPPTSFGLTASKSFNNKKPPPRPMSPPGTGPPAPSSITAPQPNRPSQLPIAGGYVNVPGPKYDEAKIYEDVSPPHSPYYVNDTPPPPPRPPKNVQVGLNKPPPPLASPDLMSSPTSSSWNSAPKTVPEPSTKVSAMKSLFDQDATPEKLGRTQSTKPSVAKKPSNIAVNRSHSSAVNNSSAVNRADSSAVNKNKPGVARNNSTRPPPPPKPGASNI